VDSFPPVGYLHIIGGIGTLVGIAGFDVHYGAAVETIQPLPLEYVLHPPQQVKIIDL